ncbi:hypothetical protein EVAR_26441_1 [Eumeta japonica]|uniref:Uncharacterized protein n=1 Tax=Eumeta variegata TaxID=151549 RepID=A0A4C1VNS8_EUMVA|nr:hypothetical protein EVAR_26441_1 [Eumeta japonica]
MVMKRKCVVKSKLDYCDDLTQDGTTILRESDSHLVGLFYYAKTDDNNQLVLMFPKRLLVLDETPLPALGMFRTVTAPKWEATLETAPSVRRRPPAAPPAQSAKGHLLAN